MSQPATAVAASPYAVYDATHQWRRQNITDNMEVGHVAVTSDAMYVRAWDGRIFALTPQEVEVVTAPGLCDALARTSDGRLLASFIGHGVYLFGNGRWALRAQWPYGSDEGEHHAYLAEESGEIAYATKSVPHMKRSKEVQAVPEWSWSGTDALWLLRNGRLERVVLQ